RTSRRNSWVSIRPVSLAKGFTYSLVSIWKPGGFGVSSKELEDLQVGWPLLFKFASRLTAQSKQIVVLSGDVPFGTLFDSPSPVDLLFPPPSGVYWYFRLPRA